MGSGDKELSVTGSLGGIKPGNGVGGKEGPKERRRTFARRRRENEGVRDGASQHTGGRTGGGRGRERGAATFLVSVSPGTESCPLRSREDNAP